LVKSVTLSGLVVAKSGTIDLGDYLPENVVRLLGFTVIRRTSQAHSHVHTAHSHILSAEAGSDANAPVYALGLSAHTLISSKAVDSTAGAINAVTVEENKQTVEGLVREAKTVINAGLPTTTIPDDDSVALVDRTTIRIGNDVSDSLVGSELVTIRYVAPSEYGGIIPA